MDDSWIHFVYAKNLANYGNLYYNVGIPEVGTTSILWVAILSLFVKAGLDIVLSSQVLGVFFSIGLSIMIYHLSIHLTNSRKIGLLSGSFVAICPFVTLFKISGLETTLIAFLVTTAVFAYINKKYIITSILIGLSILARPEAYILALAILIIFTIDNIKSKRFLSIGTLKTGLHLFLPAIILASLWIIICLNTTGYPLPTTFYAKVHSIEAASFIQAFLYSITALHPYMIYPAFPIILVLSFSAVVLIYRKKRIAWFVLLLTPFLGYLSLLIIGRLFSLLTYNTRYWFMYYHLLILLAFYFLYKFYNQDIGLVKQHTGKNRYRLYLSGILTIFFIMYLVVTVGGIHFASMMIHVREVDVLFLQLLPYILTLAIVVGIGGIAIIKLKYQRFILPNKIRRLLVASLIIFVFSSASLSTIVYADIFAVSVKNINEQQVFMGKWINKNLPKSAVIAINDAGAIKYFGNRSTIDLLGLNTYEIIPYRRRGQDAMFEYLRIVKPDYLVVYPEFFKFLNNSAVFNEIYRSSIEDNIICAGDTVVVYACNWREINITT